MKYLLLVASFSIRASGPERGATRIFLQEVATVCEKQGIPVGPVDQITWEQGTLTARTGGTYQFQNESWVPATGKSPDRNIEKAPVPKGTKVLAQVRYKNSWVVGTDQGLYLYEGKKQVKVYPADRRYSWSLRNVTYLPSTRRGGYGLAPMKQGIWTVISGRCLRARKACPTRNLPAPPPDRMAPSGSGRSAEPSRHKTIFSSTGPVGGGYPMTTYWTSPCNPTARPGSRPARALAGLNQKEMTLEAKAAFFTSPVETRHNRMGFIAHSELTKQFQIGSSQVAISDNDGMYTAMYSAAPPPWLRGHGQRQSPGTGHP